MLERLPEFFANHPLLLGAFLAILGMLGWTFVQGSTSGVKRLSPVDAIGLINHDDAVVLDVRSDGEFRNGHIVNAVHVPQADLDRQLDKLGKYRARPIIAACRTGNQSAKACGALRKHGFEQVYQLTGGLQGWEAANLPLTKK